MRAALRRSIGLPQATAMVVGTIVGASIFVQPSEVSRAAPTFGGMLLVWVAAGALTWFGASICAELASAYPQTGGVYVFLRQMFSPAAGFLWGWAMFWSMHSASSPRSRSSSRATPSAARRSATRGIRGIAVGRSSACRRSTTRRASRRAFRPGDAYEVAAIVLLLVVLFGLGASRLSFPPPRRKRDAADFSRRSSPGSSRSAAGTW